LIVDNQFILVRSGLLAALAEIEARTGRPEEAVKILRQLLTAPTGEVVSIARLKIDPVYTQPAAPTTHYIGDSSSIPVDH
jgi:hypothetical protein